MNATKMVEIHPFQCPQLFDLAFLDLELLWHFESKFFCCKNPSIVYTQCKKKERQDCSDSRNTQEVMHERKKMCNISSFPIHFIPENEIFDPIVMMVKKLIYFLTNFLGPREEIGFPSQQYSFCYLGPN